MEKIENIQIHIPLCGVLSLYVAMPPHTAILPKTFICCKAAVEKGPPTWNVKKKKKYLKWSTWLFLCLWHIAYIFKEAVVSVWRSLLQGFLERTDSLIVEGLVEAQFFEISHLGVWAGWSHHLAPLDLGNLAHHGAHRPCCGVHQQSLTLLEIQDLFYPVQSSQSK